MKRWLPANAEQSPALLPRIPSVPSSPNIASRRIDGGGPMDAWESLCETNHLLTAILNGTHAMVACVDPEFNFLMVNRAYAAADGREPDFFPGKNHFALYPNAENEAIFRRVVQTGEPCFYCAKPFVYAEHPERGVTYWDWSLIPVKDSTGAVTCMVFTLMDVTRSKEDEVALQRSVHRLELLSDVSAQLLASDRPQEIVESLCRKVMAHLDCHVFFNFLVDRDTGRLRLNACAGILPEAAEKIEWLDNDVTICACVATAGCRIVAENIAATPDPRTDMVRSFGVQAYACHPLLNQGRVIGTLSFGTRTRPAFAEDELALMKAVADQVAIAMERIRLLQRVEKKAAEAQAANVAKSQFLANISHELRTPMNAILGMTELALGERLSPTACDYLQTARESAGVLLELLNEILDFSRMESGRFELESAPFRLRELLDQTLKTLGIRAYEKGLELVCDVSQEVPDRLVGDSLRLRQILVNLIGNAIKFTRQGEVVVRVSAASQTPEQTCLQFSISDTGIGISPEHQEKIFAPFTQVDASTTRRFGGTGLGLSIVANLVQLMDGRISVESQLGLGSTFSFTAVFPIPQGPAEEPEEQSPVRDELLRGVPVLVVDDNPTSRRILEQILASRSMRPELVSDVPMALTKIHEAAASGRRFPVILADAMIPGIDGFTLASWIKNNPDLVGATVLMLSSAERPILAQRAAELDVICVDKPISQADLLRAIHRALSGVAGPEPGPGESPAACEAAPPVRPLRVLLAEDTPANQKLIVRLLAKHGHTVEVAANGEEAVQRAEREPFDLVLMDVQMPLMDGFDATKAIRALPDPDKARLPIVAMTAHAMKGDRERCLEAGMDAYVAKPIDTRELFRTIENIARR